MVGRYATPRTNVFEVLIGRKGENLKWDPLWNLMRWLCEPCEGHGLKLAFQKKLTEFAFEHAVPELEVEQEYKLDPKRWPDLALFAPAKKKPQYLILMDDVDRKRAGEKRKRENLKRYAELGTERVSVLEGGVLRLLVLTNAHDEGSFGKLHACLDALGDRRFAWKLLCLPEVGRWIRELAAHANPEARPVLDAFAAWCESLREETQT